MFDQKIGPEFELAVEKAWKEQGRLIEAEIEVLGITHAQVGYTLLKHWQLPSGASEAALYHHSDDFSDADPENLELIRIVALADNLSKVFGFDQAGDSYIDSPRADFEGAITLSDENLEELYKQVEREIGDFKQFLGLDSDSAPVVTSGLENDGHHVVVFNPHRESGSLRAHYLRAHGLDIRVAHTEEAIVAELEQVVGVRILILDLPNDESTGYVEAIIESLTEEILLMVPEELGAGELAANFKTRYIRPFPISYINRNFATEVNNMILYPPM